MLYMHRQECTADQYAQYVPYSQPSYGGQCVPSFSFGSSPSPSALWKWTHTPASWAPRLPTALTLPRCAAQKTAHCPLLWNTSEIPKYVLVQGSPPFPERTDSPSSPERCCVSLERELPVQRSPSIVIRACKTSWSMGRYGLDSCHVYVTSTDDTQAMISVVPLCVYPPHTHRLMLARRGAFAALFWALHRQPPQ